jgi:hypothetical protein
MKGIHRYPPAGLEIHGVGSGRDPGSSSAIGVRGAITLGQIARFTGYATMYRRAAQR